MKPEKIKLPPVVFGTSILGNLYTAPSDGMKNEIVKECIRHSSDRVVFDSAGKYGAGLALESLGKFLKENNARPEDVVISNKLGWMRTDLKTPEPTFEPGVWKGLRHDAVQKISYDGIIDCFEQGNKLLNGYIPQLVSVHDPDEYLNAAVNEEEKEQRYSDILNAYRALIDLKQQGRVQAIGVGAKTWNVIRRIAGDVKLDWVMIANSMTIRHHPDDLLAFMASLADAGTDIINSAVFHAGFLTGGDYYDYKLVRQEDPQHREKFEWREKFFSLCMEFSVKPAEACVKFAMSAPGVKSIALNTSNPARIKENVEMAYKEIPVAFWQAMKNEGLISKNYRYL